MYTSRDGFVPPYVLAALGRSGDQAIREPAQATHERSARRRARRAKRAGRRVAPRASDGARSVYDCKQTFEQRVGDPVRGEGEPAVADIDVDDAYDFAGTVRDWFGRTFGRNSLDGKGLPLILNVHYGVRYMNAFWDGDEMTFGDGDGRVFTSFARSLDVVAHELGHGVTQYDIGLEYRGQSGALNEHYSDVWAAAITQFADGTDAAGADWLIGDEVLVPELRGQALRSMKAPGTAYDNPLMGKDPQPAHMRDYYDGPDDNQGVHINSGIPNRAFYLTSLDLGTGHAAAIWYRAQRGLTRNAQFGDAVEALAAAAGALGDAGEVDPRAQATVRSAFAEVGLATERG